MVEDGWLFDAFRKTLVVDECRAEMMLLSECCSWNARCREEIVTSPTEATSASLIYGQHGQHPITGINSSLARNDLGLYSRLFGRS